MHENQGKYCKYEIAKKKTILWNLKHLKTLPTSYHIMLTFISHNVCSFFFPPSLFASSPLKTNQHKKFQFQTFFHISSLCITHKMLRHTYQSYPILLFFYVKKTKFNCHILLLLILIRHSIHKNFLCIFFFFHSLKPSSHWWLLAFR